jgi:hypothetical protein
MFDHDRYQTFCRFCQRKFEADTLDEAVALAREHERKWADRPHRSTDTEPEHRAEHTQ